MFATEIRKSKWNLIEKDYSGIQFYPPKNNEDWSRIFFNLETLQGGVTITLSGVFLNSVIIVVNPGVLPNFRSRGVKSNIPCVVFQTEWCNSGHY